MGSADYDVETTGGATTSVENNPSSTPKGDGFDFRVDMLGNQVGTGILVRTTEYDLGATMEFLAQVPEQDETVANGIGGLILLIGAEGDQSTDEAYMFLFTGSTTDVAGYRENTANEFDEISNCLTPAFWGAKTDITPATFNSGAEDYFHGKAELRPAVAPEDNARICVYINTGTLAIPVWSKIIDQITTNFDKTIHKRMGLGYTHEAADAIARVGRIDWLNHSAGADV